MFIIILFSFYFVVNSTLTSRNELSCNFDDHNFCAWSDSTDKSLGGSWQVSQDIDWDANQWLPKFDHTTKTNEGGFAFANRESFTKTQANLTAIAKNDLKASKYCFRLWFINANNYNRTRTLVTISDSDGKSIVDTRLPRRLEWSFFEADFEKKVDRDLTFAIKSNAISNSATTLDDIEIHHGKCNNLPVDRDTVLHCSFEYDNCGFSNNEKSTSITVWKRYESSKSIDTMSEADMSAMVMETTDSDAANSILYSKLLRSKMACLTFWYKIETENDVTAKLTVKLVRGDDFEQHVTMDDLIFEDQGHRGDQWQVGHYQIEYDGQYRILFVGNFDRKDNNQRRAKITIDDIHIQRDECSPMMSCDFSDDACLWKNINKIDHGARTSPQTVYANIDWNRHPSTINAGRFPTTDATGGQGAYLLASVNDPTADVGEAIFASPRIDWADQKVACLRYHGYLGDDGSEEIDIYQRSSFDEPSNLIHKYEKVAGGENVRNWTRVNVNITRQGGDDEKYCWLYLVGFYHDSQTKKRFLAVDNLVVNVGQQCPRKDVEKFVCVEDRKEIDGDKVCNNFNDCDDGSDEANCGYSCNFVQEDGDQSTSTICGWRIGANDGKSRWTVVETSAVPKRSEHPILIMLSYAINAWTDFMSPVMKLSHTECHLDLWSWLHSETPNTLSADLLIEGRRVQLWDGSNIPRAAERDRKWIYSQIPIGRVTDDFQLAIRVKTSVFGFLTMAAIDELALNNCIRPDYRSNTTVSCDDGLKCDNGNCVRLDQVCDGQDDCGDGTDESQDSLALCDYKNRVIFDDDGFGFVENVNNKWTMSAGVPRINDGPTRDHTNNRHTGKFIIVTSLYGSSPSVELKIVGAKEKGQCLSFYVSALGQKVDLKVNDKSQPIIFDQQGLWQQVYVHQVDDDVKISTKVSRGYVAIDDVTFNRQCRGLAPTNSTPTDTTPPPPPHTTLPPTPEEKKVTFHCNSDSKQIPKFLICDDVDDCSGREDEDDRLCGDVKCGYPGIFCRPIGRRDAPTCLNQTKLYCDGKNDCIDGVDEDPRLCDIYLSCDGFCQLSDQCRPTKEGKLFNCDCPTSMFGKRCQYKMPPTPKTDPVVTDLPQPTSKPTEPTDPPTEPPKTNASTKKPTTKPTTKPTEKPEEGGAKGVSTTKVSIGLGGGIDALIVTLVLVAVGGAGFVVYKKGQWREQNDQQYLTDNAFEMDVINDMYN